MSYTAEVQKRNKYFYHFCEQVCPSFLKGRSEHTIKDIILIVNNNCDLEELVKQATKFKSEHSMGVNFGGDIDFGSNSGRKFIDYKKKASELIKEKTGIYIPPLSTISFKFYEAIINDSIIGNKNQLTFPPKSIAPSV